MLAGMWDVARKDVASVAPAEAAERHADAAGAAFDRDAPASAGAIIAGPLTADTRRAAERTLGASLADVRVHSDVAAQVAARRVDAAAFTLGSDVVVGPSTGRDHAASRRLLAHELAHVVQQRRDGVSLQRTPSKPSTAAGFPTVAQVLTPDGAAFLPAHTDLQQRYDRYRQGRNNPAPPSRWVRLARDSNRAALLAVLGPNLGDEAMPDDPNEEDVLRLGELQRPTGYSDEQLRADLELLRRHPGTLDRKLGTIPQGQLERGEIGGGFVRNALGNVGEALGEPVLQLRLAELRHRYPDAQIFRNVRVRMAVGTNRDGTPMLGPALEFSDGIIGRTEGSGIVTAGRGLQILYVQEVKGGAHGGQEATEQNFRWIEHNIDENARLVLADGREFSYNPGTPGGVRGLPAAPRGIVTAQGVGHLGLGGGMGIAAPVDRIELNRTPAQLRYLSGLLLLSLSVRDQMRRLQQAQRTAYEARGSADFTDPEIVQRVIGQHDGLAVASGRLYQLRAVGTGLTITERPVVSFAFVYPPGSPLPTATPALPPGPPPPRQLGPGTPTGAQPPPMPQLAPPVSKPVTPQLGAGTTAPLLMPRLRPVTDVANGAVPATALGEWLPRVGGLGDTEWVIWSGSVRDAQGRPFTGYQEGETWVRVIRTGGTPLPEIDPATGSPAPSGRVMTPQGPVTVQATPYESPGTGRPSPGTRAVAGGLGLIMVINEILGPIAATRDVQRQHNARMQGLIQFFTEFGAEPTWAVEDLDRGLEMLPWNTEQSIGAVWGHWRAARITALNVPAFLDRLPGRLPDFQSLILFLSTCRALGVIEQQGSRYFLTVRGVTYTEITATIERLRAQRLRTADAEARTDMLAKGGQGIYRIRSSGVTIHRYGDRVREKRTLTSFNSPVLTAPEFLGSGAWAREVVNPQHPSNATRLHVEPANAEAAAVAQAALYIVHKSIDSVYEEIQGQGRAITSRQPPEGQLQRFTAGAFPPELGPTTYERHPDPDASRMYTIASGQLLQFWVDRDDLEPVTEHDATTYAYGAPVAPAPSRLFTTEKRQDLPIM